MIGVGRLEGHCELVPVSEPTDCPICFAPVEPEDEMFEAPGDQSICAACRREAFEDGIGYDG